MSIQEIGGSPKEQYDLDHFHAQREFLIPWEDRQEFAQHVLGATGSQPQSAALSYPGTIKANAVRLKMEPFPADAIGVSALLNLETDLPQYDGACLKATVFYESAETSRNDLPLVTTGSVTYRMVMSHEEVILDLDNWNWEDNIMPLQSISVPKRVPIVEHHVTWKKIPHPPWSAIHEMKGKVNQGEFLGCESETLLFEGAEGYKLYKPGYQITDEPSSFTWEIKYIFREKRINFGGNVYGWNHVLRVDSWVRPFQGQYFLYDAADFDALFLPEP